MKGRVIEVTIYSNVTHVASLIGDPTRTAILMALIDGKSLPAGELAKLANVSPQTASNHLSKLVDGGLIKVESWGRHRYFSLASADIAKAIEALAIITPPAPVRSLRQSNQAKALQFARTCYDHIAGEFGVKFSRSLVHKGYLEEADDGYILTRIGETWLREFGINEANIRKASSIIPWHIDWTERVHHIAGPIAVAITKHLLELSWITQGQIQRSIIVTEQGKREFQKQFNISFE